MFLLFSWSNEIVDECSQSSSGRRGNLPFWIIFAMNSWRCSKRRSKQVHSPKSMQFMLEHFPQQLDFMPISPCLSTFFDLSLNLKRRELHLLQKETLVMEGSQH